ncbi:hypothetical protein BHM03_00057553 [Ensete ventricosum]|nr:hypothetical protein BHM03_00057553 [Ensete ventricosum]
MRLQVRVSALPASGRPYDRWRPHICARLASRIGSAMSAGQLSEAGRRGVEEFERGLLHLQLARELYTLPSEVLMARAAKEMVLEELEKIKREKAEELLRRKASEKELQEIRGHLGDAQQLLRVARTRARRMDDELLQAVKDLESA